MDKLLLDMQSKGLVFVEHQDSSAPLLRLGNSNCTIEQAISCALMNRSKVNYLQRDKIDWQDWQKGNMN